MDEIKFTEKTENKILEINKIFGSDDKSKKSNPKKSGKTKGKSFSNKMEAINHLNI